MLFQESLKFASRHQRAPFPSRQEFQTQINFQARREEKILFDPSNRMRIVRNFGNLKEYLIMQFEPSSAGRREFI